MLVTFMRPIRNNNLGGLVQSWVKITQGYSAKFEFRLTEKRIRENAFVQKKKKAGLNLILG